MEATGSTQPDTADDGTISSSRQTPRPVLRRRDLVMYPDPVQSPSPLPPTPARVTFQPSENKSSTTKPSWPVRDSIPGEDTWSWDEDDENEKVKGLMKMKVDKHLPECSGDDEVCQNNSNSCCDPVAMMLDRLYGSDNPSDPNVTGSHTRTKQDDDRWWDKYRDGYSDIPMVQEWKRRAFQFVPDSTLLKDGDQIIRVDGEDGNGRLLYEFASCR